MPNSLKAFHYKDALDLSYPFRNLFKFMNKISHKRTNSNHEVDWGRVHFLFNTRV